MEHHKVGIVIMTTRCFWFEFFGGQCQNLGNVTTRRDIRIEHIHSLGFHAIREGVTLRKLGCKLFGGGVELNLLQARYAHPTVQLTNIDIILWRR